MHTSQPKDPAPRWARLTGYAVVASGIAFWIVVVIVAWHFIAKWW
jgi:hypothetical protein